jgi:hypothetical protein
MGIIIKFCCLFFLLFTSIPSFGKGYCLALRGNGEKMPAHWGALATVVQEKGLPRAMSGGSSASLTIFLLESLALNKKIKSKDEVALLIKSFQGYFEALTQTSEGRAVAALLSDKEFLLELTKAADKLEELDLNSEQLALFQKQLSNIETLLQSPDFSGLINPEFLNYVQDTIKFSKGIIPKVDGSTDSILVYRKTQISKTIKNFGKFDAQKDETLFFRPGLISFSNLAKIIGQMADYYAGVKLKNIKIQEQVDQDFSQFLAACLPGTQNMSWREINEQRPVCRQILGRSVITYRETSLKEKQKGVRVYKKIGDHIATFPTTSILIGNAVERYKKAKSEYPYNSDIHFGQDFLVSQDELRFGYWGKEKDLKKIETQLRSDSETSNDEKSKKFKSLGNKIWLEALSSSPAEPGLSNLVELDSRTLSAGGWSDLHPTLILKAFGCKDIVYITRKGGESLFAQGVIKKLTNIDGFDWNEWENLNPEHKRHKNSMGVSEDAGVQASTWSRLYNMGNPQSSIRNSMRVSSTVVCTDWDNFDPLKDLNSLVEDAMRAPWLKSPNDICR